MFRESFPETAGHPQPAKRWNVVVRSVVINCYCVADKLSIQEPYNFDGGHWTGSLARYREELRCADFSVDTGVSGLEVVAIFGRFCDVHYAHDGSVLREARHKNHTYV